MRDARAAAFLYTAPLVHRQTMRRNAAEICISGALLYDNTMRRGEINFRPGRINRWPDECVAFI